MSASTRRMPGGRWGWAASALVAAVLVLVVGSVAVRVRRVVAPPPVHAAWDFRDPYLGSGPKGEPTYVGTQDLWPLGSIRMVFDGGVVFQDDSPELSSATVSPTYDRCPEFESLHAYYALDGDDKDPEAVVETFDFAVELVARLRAAGIDMVDDPDADRADERDQAGDPDRWQANGLSSTSIAAARITGGGRPYLVKVFQRGVGVFLAVTNLRFDLPQDFTDEQHESLARCEPIEVPPGGPWDD